ncbi:unnamed protein product [Rotaria sordida]|uniref:MITD1 C-terminal phospholipase D-like domain-containing protein n=2 Tax=Rotaria sordida TaxID=392033 RepID=A0A814CGP0_9BILA|nr:unnamed protein product [Rotaria sordida]CAF1012446.1 unnamed protein product [Rotaria sordida]
MVNLPIRSYREQGSQCNDDDPYVEIEDSQISITRLCGNSHTRKLFETCSNTILTGYKNFNLKTNNIQYKGFQFYFESIEKIECSDITTIISQKSQEPFISKEETLCALSIDPERNSFSCTPDHGLVFLQSYEFITNNLESCDITQHTCHYLSDEPQALCSGQQSCAYIHSISIDPQLNICHGNKGDSIQFFFINGKQLSIYLYIIDLSIRDISTIDSTSTIECYDSIIYRDGKITKSLCRNIDQPIFEYQTDKDAPESILNIMELLPSNILTTTTKPVGNTTIKHSNHKSMIASILSGVIVVLLYIIGFIFYRHRLCWKGMEGSKIEYRRDIDTINSNMSNGRNENHNSISSGVLTDSAPSTFTTKTYHEQIQIKDGSLGNSYEKIFNRFLDETVTQITIQDPYIRAFHQISNFLRFCEVIIKSPAKIKRIDLITGFETNEQAKQTQIEQLNQFKEHLATKYSIELTIQYLTGLHDREIKLNNGWIIKIGRGLDFYKPPESKLSIGYYDLDLRPCHQTTIDIFHAERVHPSS